MTEIPTTPLNFAVCRVERTSGGGSVTIIASWMRPEIMSSLILIITTWMYLQHLVYSKYHFKKMVTVPPQCLLWVRIPTMCS